MIQKKKYGCQVRCFYNVKIPTREYLLPQCVEILVTDPPITLHDLKWFY